MNNLAGDTSCNYFASLNFCTSNSYFGPVLFYNACLKACGGCSSNSLPSTTTTTPTTKPCLDIQSKCIDLANYCNMFVNSNPHPCAKTCKLC